MFCSNCGAQNGAEVKFCSSCGTAVNAGGVPNPQMPNNSVGEVPAGQVNNNMPNNVEMPNMNNGVGQMPNQPMPNQHNQTGSDPNMAIKILAYIGILWLVGLFVQEKNDPQVRFHVGQGIILTITSVILGTATALINSLVIANIFTRDVLSWMGWETGVTTVSGTGILIMTLLNLTVWIFILVLAIIGIVNASKNTNKPLPIIGGMAFYK